jgi:hypothetical protein
MVFDELIMTISEEVDRLAERPDLFLYRIL